MANLYDQLKKIKNYLNGDDKKNQSNQKYPTSFQDKTHNKNINPKSVNSINIASKEPSPKITDSKKIDVNASPGQVKDEKFQPILNKSSPSVESEITHSLGKKLYRQHFFKHPESWVANGGKTQISNKDFNNFVDIYIGIDFGTSFTKAAVGLMDKIYPVEWSGLSNFDQKYLLPSEYCILSDESIFIGQHPKVNYSNFKSDLKLPFINNKNLIPDDIEYASIFLALIIRYIRGWTYHNYLNLLQKKNIRWHLNLGAPSNGLEGPSLRNIYLNLAKYSWDKSNIESTHAVKNCNYNNHRECLDLISVEVFPEFVAQMAGYLQSSQRVSGLHALIDVGGGTLDVVTYIVHQDQEREDVFPFLVPEVKPFGTQILNLKRFEIKEVRQNKLEIDELAPVLDAYSFAKFASVPSKLVTNVDDVFSEKISALITDVFRLTKNKRYRLSNAWEAGVRTFFTGGGSNSAFYKNAINKAQHQSKGGLILTLLPRHPKLDNFLGDDRDYQRISVACGLAQDSFTLGKVRPAKEVEDDIAPPPQPSVRERLDRDDLYPK